MVFKTGDIFAEPVDALVCPVNCVGVMGKGLALEFKKRWPKYYERYRKQCFDHEITLWSPAVYRLSENAVTNVQPLWIISFPTKKHWSDKSDIVQITLALGGLLRVLENHSRYINSVAIPALGCGEGGLRWEDVKPRIELLETYYPKPRYVVFEPR